MFIFFHFLLRFRFYSKQMKECSELATIQTYKPFDIVYGKDKDRLSPVHIVLSGRCSIIQYLNMNVGFTNNLRSICFHRVYFTKSLFRFHLFH